MSFKNNLNYICNYLRKMSQLLYQCSMLLLSSPILPLCLMVRGKIPGTLVLIVNKLFFNGGKKKKKHSKKMKAYRAVEFYLFFFWILN